MERGFVNYHKVCRLLLRSLRIAIHFNVASNGIDIVGNMLNIFKLVLLLAKGHQK